jgi:hypothetical protein
MHRPTAASDLADLQPLQVWSQELGTGARKLKTSRVAVREQVEPTRRLSRGCFVLLGGESAAVVELQCVCCCCCWAQERLKQVEETNGSKSFKSSLSTVLKFADHR